MEKNILISFLVLFCSCKNERHNLQEHPVKTVMVVFAHADDETTVSPVLSKLIREGAEVHLIVATDGRHGVRPHFDVLSGDQLAEIRMEEMQCAAEKIGITSLVLLGFEDGALAHQSSLQPLGKKVDSLYRLIEPDLMISWGPDGGYGHPDHRTVSNISTEVFQKNLPDDSKSLLYFAQPNVAISSIPKTKTEIGKLLQHNWKVTDRHYLNYPVIVEKDDIALGREALSCHTSQFTADEMEDFYNLLHQYSDTVFFRSWHK